MKDEKLKIAKENNRVIYSGDYVLSDEISLEEFKKYLEITKDNQLQTIFNSIYSVSDNVKISIKKILNDNKYLETFKKISHKLGRLDEGIGDDLFDMMANDDFTTLIYLLDNELFERKTSLYKLNMLYRKIKKIDNWKDNKDILNDFMQDNKYYEINNILEYYKKRDEFYKEEIEKGNFDCSKIANSYFGVTLEEIKEIIIKTQINNIFTNFINLENKEEQLAFLDLAKKNKNYFKNLKEKIKEDSKEDIAKKVNSIILPGDNKIVELKGNEFLFLIHRIKGLLKGEITDKLDQDISNWDKHYEEDSYISCSLINQLYLSFTTGDHLTLGFKEITKEDIIAMNTKDMCFLKQDLLGNQINKASNFMNTNQLLENSDSTYNEVVLRRYREKEAIMPDYLVSFDKVDDKTKNASEYFNIPIYLIILEKYADLLIKNLEELKNTNPELYLKYLKRLKGCMNCSYNYLKNYYDIILQSEALKTDNKEANEIIEYIKKNKRG